MSDPIRVLLVEDSEDDAALIRRALTRGGIALSWKRVDSEAQFMSALDDDWDLIVSDFRMPHFDGLRAFSLYKEREIDVPFIFVSGALGEERAVEAMRAGARDYLLKSNLARLAVAAKRELAAAESRTAQRLAEEATQREQRRLAMAVEASGAGVFEHGLPLHQGTHFTDRFAEILGYEAGEIPPNEGLLRFLSERLHPEDLDATREAYENFVSGAADRFEAEMRIRHKEGHWLEAAALAKAVQRGADARASHVVGVLLDISERRRLEAQLRQAQKMEAIGQLAGGLAHDFNNLLAVILTAGTFVLETLGSEGPAREDMEEVLRAAKRAGELTSQLLAFSRTKPVSPRILDVNSVITDLDRMLRRMLGEDVSLSTTLSENLWNVRIDPGSLEQVIANLVVNARDAMPHGGTLSIRTRNTRLGPVRTADLDVSVPHGDYVQIAITDDGDGMDEQTQRRIFEPFFTTKETGRGTGLGLSTCYGIVKQADGFIWCRSRLGRGTTFEVQLPRVLEPTDRGGERDREPQAVRGGDEAILLVEDDDQLRRTVARLLTNLGYDVIAVSRGADALRHCEGPGRIDLLLTDVVMPEMGGVELSVKAQESRPGLKVLYMSGYTSDAVARAAGAGRHSLEKPFTPATFGRKVRQVLDE